MPAKLVTTLIMCAILAGCASSLNTPERQNRTVSREYTPPAAMNLSEEEFQEISKNKSFLPIVRVAPMYPVRAAEEKIEGYVVVSFTVDKSGQTQNVRVIESSNRLFEASAVSSAEKYRYRPLTVDGEGVEVNDVKVRIEFLIGF